MAPLFPKFFSRKFLRYYIGVLVFYSYLCNMFLEFKKYRLRFRDGIPSLHCDGSIIGIEQIGYVYNEVPSHDHVIIGGRDIWRIWVQNG